MSKLHRPSGELLFELIYKAYYLPKQIPVGSPFTRESCRCHETEPDVKALQDGSISHIHSFSYLFPVWLVCTQG
jgi:hypothetical protein